MGSEGLDQSLNENINNTRNENDSQSIEDMMGTLDQVIGELESGRFSLEESFAYYEKGLHLIKNLSNKIDMVEKKCLVLEENGETHEF